MQHCKENKRLNKTEFFQVREFESLTVQAFKQATGRQSLPAKTGHLLQTPYRHLIRVGLLGPAFGGQCILDFPLLTALNLFSLQVFNQSFSSLNQQNNQSEAIKKILGFPTGQPVTYRCQDTWVKRIDIALGPVFQHEVLKVTYKEVLNKPGILRVQPNEGPVKQIQLNENKEGVFEQGGTRFCFRVLTPQSVEMELDESEITVGPVPPQPNETHILTQIEGHPYLVKSGGSIVKSSLLEMANLISPAMIPERLTGDISPPRLIPFREASLSLPNLKRYQTEIVLMGAGPVRIVVELGNLSNFSAAQLEVLKELFDHTFYHPELKKIFG